MNLDFVSKILISESYRSGNVMTGSYYTPIDTALEIINRVCPSPDESIIEPSCGSGVFVFAILMYASENYNLTPMQLKEWFVSKVSASDINDDAVINLRKNISSYFTDLIGIESNESDFKNIICKDGLNVIGSFDLAVGNPPYVNAKNLTKEQASELKKKYKSCNGARVDLYLAFTEHYMKISKRVCFLIPRGFTRNNLNDDFKEAYKNKIKWVRFYGNDLFKDANIYTMSFEYDNTKKYESVHLTSDGETNLMKFEDVFTNFQSVVKSDLVIQGDLATLSNKLYKARKDGNKYIATNHLGELFFIEPELVKIAIKGTKIRVVDGFVELKDDDYIIFPYLCDNSPIEYDDMISKYPNAFRYFQSIESVLKRRDRGKAENYDPFYIYGRKQGLGRRDGAMYIIFPKIVGGESQPKVIKTESFCGVDFFLFSGYSLEIDDESELDMFKGFYDYISKICQPYKGTKEDYYSISPKVILRYIEYKRLTSNFDVVSISQ